MFSPSEQTSIKSFANEYGTISIVPLFCVTMFVPFRFRVF